MQVHSRLLGASFQKDQNDPQAHFHARFAIDQSPLVNQALKIHNVDAIEIPMTAKNNKIKLKKNMCLTANFITFSCK